MRPPRSLLVVSIIAALLGLTVGFGSYPLLEPDEGRNATVAREMAERNNYLLPRLNGLPYVDKPVVYFAAAAVSVKLFGPNEVAARLPSLIFTLLTALLIAWFARRLFGVTAAWIAAIAYLATPFTLAYARTVIFDSALTFFVVAALVAFHRAVEEDWDWWAPLAWVAVALGILTKGPVMLIFPLLVALPYAVWRKRAKAVLDPVGILACVALMMPWVMYMSHHVPDYVGYVLVTETTERLLTDRLDRTGPFWYFLPIILGATLPWIPAAVTAAARRGVDRQTVFFLLWILVPLVFFSFSQSKRPQYVLPLVPPVALLLAAAWHDQRGHLPGARIAGGLLVAIGGFAILSRNSIADWARASEAVAQTIPQTALVLGGATLLSGVTVFFVNRRLALLLLAMTLPVASIPLAGLKLMRTLGEERSAAALARAIRPALAEDTEIVGVGAYPLSLPFYLGKPVTLATATGAELTSNYVLRRTDQLRRLPDSPLRPPGWWQEAVALCTRPRVFLVRADDARSRSVLERYTFPMAESAKYAVYGPCGETDLAAATR